MIYVNTEVILKELDYLPENSLYEFYVLKTR